MLYFQIISQYQTLRRISFDLELWESILESIQQAMLVAQIVKRVFDSTPLSETYQNIEETVEEQDSSQNGMLTSKVEDYPDHPLSHNNTPMNLESGEVDGSSSAIQESNESKQDTALPSEGHQYPGMHISPNYSDGFVPLMLGPQLTPSDNSESQARDISRLPSFVVHQPFDPNYYAQYYRSGADSEGRLSPLPSAGVTTKYNGGVPVLPTPSSRSLQEGAVLSTAGQTQHATQAAGLMQNSITVSFIIIVFVQSSATYLFITPSPPSITTITTTP